jgi:hypothetical protein
VRMNCRYRQRRMLQFLGKGVIRQRSSPRAAE